MARRSDRFLALVAGLITGLVNFSRLAGVGAGSAVAGGDGPAGLGADGPRAIVTATRSPIWPRRQGRCAWLRWRTWATSFGSPLRRSSGREWFGPVPATCLGRGENGAVLAGLADGRICRIYPATLATTELRRLTGKLQGRRHEPPARRNPGSSQWC